MIRSLTWTILLAGICTLARAAESDFRFSKELDLPTLKQEELFEATLDSDVYAATRDGIPDVRIRAGGTADVSFLLLKSTITKSQTTRDYWAAIEPTIKPLKNDALEITLHLAKDDPQPQGLRLVTPLHNFEQRVRVFSSADGKSWQPAGEETVIFDYSQFMDVSSNTVSFPATTDRYFRIVIDNVTQELELQLKELTRRLRGGEETRRDESVVIERRPFRIDRIEFWREVVQAEWTGDRKVGYPVTGFHLENNADTQQTIIDVDSRREPLTSFKLVTSSHNFSRHAQVEIEETQGVTKTWRTIGEANLSRLDFRNLKREDLTVSFPERRQSKYRVVIDNRGSPPLVVTSVEGQGNEYQAVFLAPVPQQSYELVFGSQSAEAPDFDTAAITASLAAGYQPTLVTLGKQVEAPGAGQAPPFSISRLLNNAWVLGGIAVLLAAALGWGLFHAGRRLNSLSQDEK